MGKKIMDAPTAAGVECPKKTGKIDKSEPCGECPYWPRCMDAIMAAMRGEG